MSVETTCDHVNVYQDDLRHEWHCDDCGTSFGAFRPLTPRQRDLKADEE